MRGLNIFGLFAILALAAGCSKEETPGRGDSDRELTISVASPPAWNSAAALHALIKENGEEVAVNSVKTNDAGAATRASVDPLTGKISWETGDVLYLTAIFFDADDKEFATRRTTAIYTDHPATPGENAGSWALTDQIYWPLAATDVLLQGGYIGTAPADGTVFVDQPVYCAGAWADFGEPLVIGGTEQTSWTIACTAITFTGLTPDDRLWISGDGWWGNTMSQSFGVGGVSLSAGPLHLTAGADGRATAYLFVNPSGACHIAVGATAPTNAADWTDLRTADGVLGWDEIALGFRYLLDVSAIAGGGSGPLDPPYYVLSTEAWRELSCPLTTQLLPVYRNIFG